MQSTRPPGLVAVGVLVALSACTPEQREAIRDWLKPTPPPPPPTCPASCDDGNACTTDSCGPATGFACSHTPAEMACNDGLSCTVNDRCVAGACRGEVLACSTGTCSETTGCPMPPPPPPQGCQATTWAQMLPGSVVNGGVAATFHGVGTNDAGDVVVGGSIWGDIVLPSGVEVSHRSGGPNLLLAKVNSGDGTVSWARSFGDDQTQFVRKVALNNDGVVGFFGDITGTIDLGNGVTVGPPVEPPAGQRPQYWTGYFLGGVRSSDGSGVFAVDLGITSGMVVDMAASPADGSFVVCGHTNVNGDARVEDVNTYVAKFSARGELLWNASASVASSDWDFCEALTVLDDGDVVFGGWYGYGPTRAVRFVKLNGSTGATTWSRTLGLIDHAAPPLSPDVYIGKVTDLAADASGDVLVAGTLFGEIDLGTRVGHLVVPGTDADQTFSSDAMVFKLDGDSGEPLWGRLFGEPVGTAVVPWEEGSSIAVDSRGDVHATFNTRRPEPAASGYFDIVQLKLGGQDGSPLCTRTYAGEEGQISSELAINRRGTGSARDQAVLLGWFNKVIDFGGGLSFQAPRDLSYFLMRFQP